MNLQARTIVRLANKLGLTLARGGLGARLNEKVACPLAVLRDSVGFDGPLDHSGFPQAVGFSGEKLYALEAGFEDSLIFHVHTPTQRRYHKVGQHIAKMAGLHPRR
jgi:hypothetical protein